MAGLFPCPAGRRARPDSDPSKKPRPAGFTSGEKREKIPAKNHARPDAAERQKAKNENQKCEKKNRPTG
jgi:hypothetical protein